MYTWGLDLSGTLQGAGGVGGLLADTKVDTNGINTYYSVGDANGNVTEYIDDTGTVKAHFKYNAFSETTYKSGTMKDDFAFGFSSKYFDPETGFYNYGNRYYDPILGRWISTDPIEELGFITSLTATSPLLAEYLMDQSESELDIGAYNFVGNNPVNYYDEFGLHYDQKSADCLCGPDVTSQVDAIRTEVSTFYSSLSGWKKFKACSYVLTPPMAIDAWDIDELRYISYPPVTSKNECERTVVYKGHCYYGGSVNYALWGMIRKECSKGSSVGMFTALTYAYAYKKFLAHAISTPPEPLKTRLENQAIGLSMTGYDSSKSPESVCLKNCRIERSGHPDHPKSSFIWRWKPYKNP